MKYIKKVAVSPIPEINGSVVDSFNVGDKTTNAPSVRAVEDKLAGTVLYNNNDGSNENITLNDSVSNYSKLIIEYKSNNGIYNSVEISDPNLKRVQLMVECEGMDTYFVLVSANVEIIDNLITWKKHNCAVLSTNNIKVQTDISYYNLKIAKVVGYK